MRKIINLVAVRLKSKRLPQKALLPLEGKPMLWHLMDRITRAKNTRQSILCTSTLPEDDMIASFAEDYGFRCFRGHPDNVLERFLGAAEKYGATDIVRVTGDNLLTDPDLIDAMSEFHIDEESEYTFTEDAPRGTRPEIIATNALRKCLELAEDPNNSEFMTYFFKDYPQVFKTRQYHLPSKKKSWANFLVTVDTPDDFEVIKKIYKSLYRKDPKFDLEDLVSYLEAEKDIDHISRRKKEKKSELPNTKLRITAS